MLNRWIGIISAVFMVGVNAVLFTHDVLPDWLAGDPPELTGFTQAVGLEQRTQVGIFDAHNQLVGRSWAITRRQETYLDVTSCTLLYPILLPNDLATPRVRIDTELQYRDQDALLDELVMTIRGLPGAVVVRGEFMPPDEFACTWRAGPHRKGAFVLDAEATRALGEVLRPFSRLSGLYVGRTWRLQLLNPLTRVLPGLRTEGFLEEPEFVRVTRTETITHRDKQVEAFVVEASRVRAWVAPDGAVLRQEIELPLLGRLTLRDEPFDEQAYDEARRWRDAQE